MTDSQFDDIEQQDAPGAVSWNIRARWFYLCPLIVCLSAEFLFLLGDYLFYLCRLSSDGGIRYLFNMSMEGSLSSWFGTSQTMISAMTLWLIFVIVRRRGASKWRCLGWLALALFFSLMTVDDGARMHERLGGVVRRFVADEDATDPSWIDRYSKWFPSYNWQFSFLPFFGAMGLFMVGFMWFELKRKSSKVLILTSIALFVVAVSMDFFEELDDDHEWNIYTIITEKYDIDEFTMKHYRRSGYSTLGHISKAIEEDIEMLANTLFLFVFLRHLTVVGQSMRFRFGEKSHDGLLRRRLIELDAGGRRP